MRVEHCIPLLERLSSNIQYGTTLERRWFCLVSRLPGYNYYVCHFALQIFHLRTHAYLPVY